ncbi:MAG: hypothetical protein ACE5HB_03115 [Terriglobia bacterium]
MQLLPGKEGVKRVTSLISEKHQVHAYAVELTAKQICNLNPTGQVDFGGSEYIAAEPRPVPTHKKHSQDRYQWWSLAHGAYLVEFNEVISLAPNEIALLEPHERLLRAGATHAVQFLRGYSDPLSTLLNVVAARMEIKQNARIATLRVYRLPGLKPPLGVAKTKSAKKKSAKKKRKR